MHVNVTDQKGETHRLEALEGFRLMEIIRDWDLNIKAECGGACACATCHVYVAEEWVNKLFEPSDEEIDRLDEAFDVEDNSPFLPDTHVRSTEWPDGNTGAWHREKDAQQEAA